MRRYSIRRVAVGTATRVGAVVGAVLGAPAGCALALAAVRLIPRLRRFLQDWGLVEYSFLDQSLRFDFVAILNLQGLRETALHLDERLGLILVLALAGVPLATALLTGLAVAAAALAYNLLARATGGIELQLDAVDPAVPLPESPRETPRTGEWRAPPP